MRFFVTMTERTSVDAQERVAMCRHRLESLRYQFRLLSSGDALAYGFRTDDGGTAVLMYELDSLEKLDLLLKRDPGWAYCMTEVVPVVSTMALVVEAQDYLGENILSHEELQGLSAERRTINPVGVYWLAYKAVKPFSPLLSIEEQDDVHRRTVTSQRAHLDAVEFADDNPVGKPVGILIAEGLLADVRKHVETCEVFPDTVVDYKELLPLERAFELTKRQLNDLGRPIREDSTQQYITEVALA